MLTAIIRMLVAWFGAACILLAFSEFIFFNEGPGLALARAPDAVASASTLVEMAIWYCLFTSVFLAALSLSHARSFAALLLCGALFGWATEGTVIAQVYEAVPVSFAAPSLYWHMLADVAFGWYALRVVLRWRSFLGQIGVFAATGLVWGVWSIWPWGDGIVLTSGEFAVYALWVTLLLGVGLVLTDLGGNAFRQLPVLFSWAAIAVSVALAGFMGIAFLPWSLALFALVALTAYALARHRRGAQETDILAVFDQRVAWVRYLAVLALPAVAIPVYGLLRENGASLPVEDITALMLLAGIIAYLWALWVCLRQQAGGERQ